MAIVAGVDFGTLSVRVSIVDSERGPLDSAVAEYPLHRKREDPEYATQSHEDHMRALAAATRQAVKKAGIPGDQVEAIALDTTGSSVIPVDQRLKPLDDYYLWCDHRAKGEAAEITEKAHIAKDSKRSSGAAASIPPSGDSRSCCTGCATTPPSARNLPLHSSIATWWLRPCAASPIPPRSSAASARWATNGCGTPTRWPALGKISDVNVDPLLAGVREKLEGEYATSDQIAGTLSPALGRETWLACGNSNSRRRLRCALGCHRRRHCS